MAVENQPGFTPEIPAAPEQSVEQIEAPESKREVVAPKPQQPSPAPQPLPVQPQPIMPAIDPIQKEVETVLSEEVAEMYKTLSAEKKKEFKAKGEEISAKISGMIKSGIIQIKQILELIREWLLIVPGVNKFFLEQEAKIKTDKIQELFDREHNRKP
ncbi:MAG: hypothetical protein NT003_01485 [Candidatus Magasanikbacteria bacterium]|nr:hypothetical protein [Candidatus Magasanikbacteria bacterium]